MKIRSILFAALFAAVLSSCAGKVAETTEITGTVIPEGISEVNVIVEGVIDTLVPVTDGKFVVVVPANAAALSSVAAANYRAAFISDGTPLEVVLGEDPKVTSKYPKISVQERLNAYNAAEDALMEEYLNRQKEIAEDSVLTQDEKEAKFEEFFAEFEGRYYGHHKQACEENADNFVSVFALNNLRGQLEDAEMSDLIGRLASVLQESKYVKGMKDALDARIATAEGTMFKDFTVEHVFGYDRSIDPQPLKKEVKFSDYVGKGTYVLVDFWSPWCGPCRREIPNIQAVYEQYKDKGLEVLSLAVWERRPQSHTIEVAGELGMDWLHINNCGAVPTEIYGVEGIPHLMLIGPDGTILKRGFHGLEGIQAAVAEYL